MNERNHVDIYMDCPGIDELPFRYMQPSAYSDSDEDPDTTVCTFHDNSLVTGGPDTASIGDDTWYRYSAPVFNHEFAHLCYKSQGIGGTLEENEMFAHFAGYLGRTPYKRPRFNPDYDACLMRANDEYAGDNDRRRNLWNLWGAYLIQQFRWPDVGDMTDDLVYRWAHEPEVRPNGSEARSFHALADILSESAYLDSLEASDGHEVLMKVIKNWTIANWLDNPNYGEGWYGYGLGFDPSIDVGIFAHNDFGAPDTIRAWSIPPDFMMDERFDNTDSLFTGTWTDPQSGGTDPIRLFPNAADYMGMRASTYFEDGRPHELRFIFDGDEQTYPDDTQLFLTGIRYSSATDSLYLMGDSVIVVDSMGYDAQSLRGELVVPGFGDSVKGVAAVISLVETEFPADRSLVDSNYFYYSYWVGAASTHLLDPDQPDIVWTPGHDKEIKWECPPVDGDEVRILLSTDGGQTYADTLAEGISNTGSCNWTVGAYDSDSCRVRVEVERDYGYVLWDESSSDFTICSGVDVFVRTDPPGGEVWIDGCARDSTGLCGGTGMESVELSVTSPQVYDGLEYTFRWWSDNGAQTHSVYPTSDTTYTATMDPTPKPHDGWPRTAASPFVSPPVLSDVDGDGVEDVILVSGNGGSADSLFVYHEDGNVMADFPVKVSGPTGIMGAPAAGDLDGDSKAEIVLADNGVRVFGCDGTIKWDSTVVGTKAGAPMVVDLDCDGFMEVFYSTTTQVFAWDHSGASLPNWPVERTVEVTNLGMGAVLAVADVDADGEKEIVSLPDIWESDGSKIWPGQLSSIGYGPAAIGDIDDDGWHEIVACDAGGSQCYAWGVEGDSLGLMTGWPVDAEEGVLPSLGHFDGDGELDVIVGGPGSMPVYDWHGTKIGEVLTSDGSTHQNEAIAGDIYDNNGTSAEVGVGRLSIVMGGGGEPGPVRSTVIEDVASDDEEYGWPTNPLCAWYEPPVPMAMGDIDNDGLMEMVAASCGAFVWDCDHDPSPAVARTWGQFRQGPGHTGAVGSPGTISTEVTLTGPECCPLGESGYIKIEVEVRDDAGDPIEGIPAEQFFIVATHDTAGAAILCLGDTVLTESATDYDGRTEFMISRIGGCGKLEMTLHAMGISKSLGGFDVRSVDLTGDCTVDFADYSLFNKMIILQDPCADLDADSTCGGVDYDIFLSHFSEGQHLCVHPGYSSAVFNPSDAHCLVLCPQGDLGDFVIDIAARNAQDSVFYCTEILADSIWAVIPPPSPPGIDAGFRFLCRQNHRKATADSLTNPKEKTTVTVNSGGGHSQQLHIAAEISRVQVESWIEAIRSPDIDANGRVDYSDVMIFSIDDQGTYNYRSDMNCDGEIDDEDLLLINAHYGHRCGASSRAIAGEGPDQRPWPDEVSRAIRAVVPNDVLDRWLAYDLHSELRALLQHVRSLSEPSELADGGGEIGSAAISLLPRATALAQSYPNPFRGVALINYQVAPPGGAVRIMIFDAAGRLVRTLVDEGKPPGFYAVSWDGRSDDGKRMANGVYFYQMRAPSFASNKRLLLVR